MVDSADFMITPDGFDGGYDRVKWKKLGKSVVSYDIKGVRAGEAW